MVFIVVFIYYLDIGRFVFFECDFVGGVVVYFDDFRVVSIVDFRVFRVVKFWFFFGEGVSFG